MDGSVRSEEVRLRRVIVHEPGECLNLLHVNEVREHHPDYLLMDDLLFLEQAQQEHQVLRQVLGQAAEVIFFRSLLRDILQDVAIRQQLVSELGLPYTVADTDPAELVEIILTARWQGQTYGLPCPNLVFARDIAAVVGKAVVLSYAAFFRKKTVSRPRDREMALMRLIVRNHPLFADYEVIDINGQAGHDELSVEGGDILVINPEIIAIGVSQRTSKKAIELLAPKIFAQGFRHILMVRLPRKRGTMHLDTVFTLLGNDECVVYEDVVFSREVSVSMISPDRSRLAHFKGLNLLQVLEELGVKLTHYLCGGGDPLFAEREQWTDGSNLLALAPGVVVSYDRNVRTAEHLHRRGGFDLLQPDEFIASSGRYLESDDKAVILVPSAELSRGRGGPRCLTLPIARD